MIENLRFGDPEPPGRLERLPASNPDEDFRRLDMVAGATICHGEEFHRVTLFREPRGGSSEADFAIVRMSSDADESHLAPQVRMVRRGAPPNPVPNR